MDCARVLLVFLFSMVSLLGRVCAVAEHEIEFSTLCEIYILAKNLASNKRSGEAEGVARNEIIELNLLNASAAGPSYNGNSGTVEKVRDKEGPPKDGVEHATRGLSQSERNEKGQAPAKEPLPEAVSQRGVRFSLKHLLEEGLKLEKEYEAAVAEANSKRLAASGAAVIAVFGKGTEDWSGSNLGDKTFTDDHGSTVGGTTAGSGKGCGHAGGNSAGLNIISDMTCLCIGRGSSQQSGTDNVCVSGLTGFADTVNDAATLKGEEGWQKLLPKCTETKALRSGTGKVTPSIVRSAITAYIGLIGRKTAKIVGNKGTPASCGGGTVANNLCVNYGKYSTAGYETIPWVKKMIEAAGDIEEAVRQEEIAKRSLSQLKIIRATAEALYAAAKNGVYDDKTAVNVRHEEKNNHAAENKDGQPQVMSTQSQNSAEGIEVVLSAVVTSFSAIFIALS